MKEKHDKKRPKLAVASLVLGIISLFSGWSRSIDWIVPLLAVIFGLIVVFKKDVRKGMAIAGIILGVIGILIVPLTQLSKGGGSSEIDEPYVPPTERVRGVEGLKYKARFTNYSNDCDTYSMTYREDIGLIRYNTEGCVFKKTVVQIFEDTPVKDFLEGTSVTCHHLKGDFDPFWVYTLYVNLEECEGDFKDKIAELLLLS